jgi:uncharacterized sporulation protein YeaH/YhbH (DUF444 family)
MPRRIEEDHKDFRDVVSGRIRRALKKFIKSGQIVRHRGKKGKIAITIPKIDIPHIVYGDSGEGAGRGPGKEGDVIGKDPDNGKGNQGGQGEAEGITINLDLEEVLRFMQDELQLPNLKKKPNETYDEVKIKYNNISLVGPESLRHNRRTLLQTLKRQAAEGTLHNLKHVPGLKDPVRVLSPINDDKRYRQYREIKIPSSNALIVFARDGSGSMDDAKCDIVSDMAWWIDTWIRRFYDRVDRLYVWHDSAAQEVDEEKFYKYRFGGGTTCSSALKFISKQFENRYPPDKWNIYVFYFTDGENWGDDNEVFIDTLAEEFKPHVVNFTGIAQILAYSYEGTVKHHVDEAIKSGKLNKEYVRTVAIGPTGESKSTGGYWVQPTLSEEERNEQIMDAIKTLLGNPAKMKKESA